MKRSRGWSDIKFLPYNFGPVLVSVGNRVGEAHLTERGWYWAGQDWSDAHAEEIQPDGWKPLPLPMRPVAEPDAPKACETGPSP